MNYKKTYTLISISILGFLMQSCLEEFPLETIDFESALVVEATITNEFKQQEVKLTRTFKFEEEGPLKESNANISVIDDLQNSYSFQESAPGNYQSVDPFSAQADRSYQLLITTGDGRSYTSNITTLSSTTQIDQVSASREPNEDGGESIVIYVDSFDPSGNSRYYRYEYEETYKIIAPFYTGLDAIPISDVPPFEVDTESRTEEEQICFNTEISNTIVQTETNGFSEDRVTRFPIRFISSQNYIITHRYSILVKQFVQSLEAFTFYKTLNELTGSESLFSENQPGFFAGNVFSVDNTEEKVLGFFEVSSVSEKRIFFNYTDFFPGEPFPPFATTCTIVAPELSTAGMPPTSPLIDAIKLETLKFFDFNLLPSESLPGPYLMVTAACGDCTKLGSNIVPDFWTE